MPNDEVKNILTHCHTLKTKQHLRYFKPSSFGPNCSRMHILFIVGCDQCQRLGSILRRNEIPLNSILDVEVVTPCHDVIVFKK